MTDTGSTPAGAPGAPLWQRLGLVPGATLALVGTPDAFSIPDLPASVELVERATEPLDVTVFFTSREATLRGRMKLLAPWVAATGALYIAWPKDGTGRETDLSEAVITGVGAESGFAAGGVESLDETWRAVRLSRPARG